MQFILRLSDANSQHMAVLTLRDIDVRGAAADFVLDVLGVADPQELVAANILAAGHAEELKALQQILFDSDDQGRFIREGVSILANGKDLDPDGPMTAAFSNADSGVQVRNCEMIVSLEGAAMVVPSAFAPNPEGRSDQNSTNQQNTDQQKQIEAFARIMFLHQIAIGYAIDVTNELPELSASIADAEHNNWIEIDVKKAAYRLTSQGQRVYDSYIAEAQDLIKRYDIYGDVDVDSIGNVQFDSGLGKDFRIPIFEMEGVDPFRARFLLGINDGEWAQLSNWFEVYKEQDWYQAVFAPVEDAPGIDSIGRNVLQRVLDAGKAQLRQDSRLGS